MSTSIQTNFKRYEKKYFLSRTQYKLLTERLTPYVKEDEYGRYTLCNIYYDTDDYRLIRSSLEKPVYKEKLRVRSYGVVGDSDTVFVELKKKFDGVVYKRRITLSPHSAEAFLAGIKSTDNISQIGREIEYFQQFYKTKPKVFIAYDRQAFQGKDDPELRITFDTNMRFRLDRLNLCEGDDGKPILDTDDILMEIKIPGVCPLWLSHLINELKINPVSFSKYGTCYTQHILKEYRQIFTKEALLSA